MHVCLASFGVCCQHGRQSRVCREYDRLEAEAIKQRCKPRYSLAAPEHEALVKSTVDLACNPKLKGKIPSAIKELLANASGLEELALGLVRDAYGFFFWFRCQLHCLERVCLQDTNCSRVTCSAVTMTVRRKCSVVQTALTVKV